MKWSAALVCLVCLWPSITRSEVPVTVTIGTQTDKTAIPTDFVGLSFGMKALLPDAGGNHFFSPTNQPLITLFRNLGISHLRVGGTTVESPPATPIPDRADISSLFAFVKAAGIQKVIYSFRLLETNSSLHYDVTNAALARYIWDKYQPYVDCFAIANEPDLQRVFKQDVEIRDFSTYLAKWRRFAAAISNAVPSARFAGPDGGSGNIKWTVSFAENEKSAGNLAVITEHFYVGGAGRDVPPDKGIDDMLSPKWVMANEALYKKMAAPVLALGLPYRFTEANDHYSGGVKDASDTFAGALWALDFLHWWAAHRASGVDFHNTQWVVNDVITLDANRRPIANPKGYGLKAFELGSQGHPVPANIQDPSHLNLTAYAVQGTKDYFVTLINKSHGAAASDAHVTIATEGTVKQAAVIYLSAPNGDVAAKTGVTLGGASLGNHEPWRGEWKPLSPDKSGRCALKLPPASAAIVQISLR